MKKLSLRGSGATEAISPATRLILACLLLLGFGLRLVDLNDPPLAFHPTRQLRSTLIARDIYYQILPNADPQKAELASTFRKRLGIYEPPIFESMVAVGYLFTGGESIAVPRVLNSIFWLLGGLALFGLARRFSADMGALLALTFYLVLPFGVEASRSFQPDPLMTSLFLGGFYALYRWMEAHDALSLRGSEATEAGTASQKDARSDSRESWKWAILAALLLGLATLVKVLIVFFVAPVAVIAVLSVYGWKKFWKAPQFWTLFLIMVLPAFYYYVLGIRGVSSDFLAERTFGGMSKLLLDTKFYLQWMRLAGSLFGMPIIYLSILGVFLLPSRGRLMFFGIWAGYLLYGLSLPYFIYTHSYYHIQLTPIIALGIAPIAQGISTQAKGQGRFWRVLFTGTVLLAVAYNAWVARSVLLSQNYPFEPLVWENIAAQIPPDHDVIALTQDYGYRLMVYGWRDVSLWQYVTSMQEVKNSKVDMITAFQQYNKQPALQEILNQYPVIEDDDFLLFDLR